MNRLKYYRESANLSQNQLAERAGVKRQSVHLYERGVTLPRVDSAIAIAIILGVNVEDIWPIEYETETITIRKLKR